MEYFDNLFTSTGNDDRVVLDLIRSRVSAKQNVGLSAPYTKEEVKSTIFSMHPDKSPCQNGMNPAFYRNFCQIVRVNFVTAYPHILSTCSLLHGLNDMHRISLCNVLYKFVAKVLSNRLKLVVGDVVGYSHNAFIARRLISDNVFVAFEVNHYLKCKR